MNKTTPTSTNIVILTITQQAAAPTTPTSRDLT